MSVINAIAPLAALHSISSAVLIGNAALGISLSDQQETSGRQLTENAEMGHVFSMMKRARLHVGLSEVRLVPGRARSCKYGVYRRLQPRIGGEVCPLSPS